MSRRGKIELKRERVILAKLGKHRKLKKDDYFDKLAKLQRKLQLISQAYLATGDRAVVVFEGWDAAGKGGTIRRMAQVLDPRGFKVWPIAAPRPSEKAHHYLYRFWERLPPERQIAVFDRSWYGRVMVERVEKLATEDEWKRAYDEINEFERLLMDDGVRMVKLFLHITPEEQLRRFEERFSNPMKRWKLSYEDFRNRRQWKEYEAAIEEMVARTSTRRAPWHVIQANDKKHGRIDCLKIITDRLGKGVDLEPRPLDPKTRAAAVEVMGDILEVED